MKKLSKTIAAVSMSLMAIGAFAQAPTTVGFTPAQTPVPYQSVVKTFQNSHAANTTSHAISSTLSNAEIDYIDGDADINTWTFGTNFVRWSPYMFLNARFTAADTTFSPFTNFLGSNLYCATSATVVYDTLWDYLAYSATGNGYVDPKPGSVTIDTITAFLGYRNTTGNNDTLIFTVGSVTKEGFPSNSVVYGADTEIILPHTSYLHGYGVDSFAAVSFTLSKPITIPSSAVGGWHFGITTTVLANKADTLLVQYYSHFELCNSADYSDTITPLGPRDGVMAHVNSFFTGYPWYSSKTWGGNGNSITWPLDTGSHAGLWVNTADKNFYNHQVSGCPGFIFHTYVQDIAIIPSVTYNNVTGINEIAASGLSVAQNYPNPFNRETTINYSLTKSSDVTFTVYDVTGRVIANNNYGNVAPGKYAINLSANTFSPGIYFYTFNVNGSTVTKKMVITE